MIEHEEPGDDVAQYIANFEAEKDEQEMFTHPEARARRILGWQSVRNDWTGNYDYFTAAQPFTGTVTQQMLVDPAHLLPLLTEEEAVEYVFRSPLLLERVIAAGWLKPIEGTPERLFPRDAVNVALDRLIKAEQPPRLPTEAPLKVGEPEIGAIQPKWIKAAKAADLLGISVRTLYDYSERGLIPQPRMLGKHRSYSVDALTKFMETPDSPNLTKADLSRILR